jgi:hypothetical protein
VTASVPPTVAFPVAATVVVVVPAEVVSAPVMVTGPLNVVGTWGIPVSPDVNGKLKGQLLDRPF